jgi:primase-polymerase (primpol)-like protein
VERNGKPTKVPYSPLTGRKASSTEPDTWGSYAEAVAARKEHGHDGIGFVFTKDDPYCGVDLDGCLDQETGEIELWAQEIVDELDSYTETSPSGTGIHILVTAALPEGRNREERLEMYDRGRYFTMTGRHLAGTPRTIEDRQEQILALRDRLFGERIERDELKRPHQEAGTGLSEEEIITRAAAADNREKFRRLWAGDTSGYASDSEADLALCSILAFWAGPDEERIDRLFRHSALCRKKWTRRADYRERTIRQALKRAEFWRGGKVKIYARKREVISVG